MSEEEADPEAAGAAASTVDSRLSGGDPRPRLSWRLLLALLLPPLRLCVSLSSSAAAAWVGDPLSHCIAMPEVDGRRVAVGGRHKNRSSEWG